MILLVLLFLINKEPPVCLYALNLCEDLVRPYCRIVKLVIVHFLALEFLEKLFKNSKEFL